MEIARILRRGREPAGELLEIVTPRTGAGAISAAESFFASVPLPEAFSLEVVATANARWFLVRARTPEALDRLEGQLGAVYPEADLRRLALRDHPELDPARAGDDERTAVCVLGLRYPPYLPLRTFDDWVARTPRDGFADPMLAVLGAFGGLPPGWRALSQLVVRPAPNDWSRDYVRMVVEHPLAEERRGPDSPSPLAGLGPMAPLLLALLAYHGYQQLTSGAWFEVALAAVGAAAGIGGLVWLTRRLGRRAVYDPALVREKLSRPGYLAALRLAVFAPADADPRELERRLGHLAAAYQQFSLAAGNSLEARRLRLRAMDLRYLDRPTPGAILNTRELAGLWHLPVMPGLQAEVPLLERTSARRHLPLPSTVAHGCHIGSSMHQGRTVPVALPEEVLRRHLLLVAKTRRGKSSLLLRLAQHLMSERAPDGSYPAVVLVDPHQDLAHAALGLVPSARRADAVYLDVAETGRPFGLNLLDAGLGWDRDKAVANVLMIFKREFDRFWGPRMEDAFRFALLTLYQANQTLCAAVGDGRRRQYTVLDIPPLLVEQTFRRAVVELAPDPTVKAWWSGYYDHLDRRLQLEISNPVQTKVQRFAGSTAARSIIGQPQSTLDPDAWLRRGSIIIVNTARGVVGEDTAALVGATLLNLVALKTSEQAALSPQRRRPVTIIVDEFHTMPGADYEAILSELAKYGANLVLATQSLTRLDVLDREQRRGLRATVFANLDGLFAFHTSAEDARYLVRELGGEVDEEDLVALGEHQCYVKLPRAGERLPTFSVHLDPPPASDAAVADRIRTASAALYGRDRHAVERDLQSALLRIQAARRRPKNNQGTGIAMDLSGTDHGAPDPQAGTVPPRTQNRNQPEKQAMQLANTQQGLWRAAAETSGARGGQQPSTELDAEEEEHVEASE